MQTQVEAAGKPVYTRQIGGRLDDQELAPSSEYREVVCANQWMLSRDKCIRCRIGRAAVAVVLLTRQGHENVWNDQPVVRSNKRLVESKRWRVLTSAW